MNSTIAMPGFLVLLVQSGQALNRKVELVRHGKRKAWQHKDKKPILHTSRLDPSFLSIEKKAAASHQQPPRQNTAETFTENKVVDCAWENSTHWRASIPSATNL